MMSDSDLVLVTDISAFISSHVANTLHKSGYRVRGTVPNQDTWSKIKWFFQGNENLESIPMEMVEANIYDQQSWCKAAKDCTYVVHPICPYAYAKAEDNDAVLATTVQMTMFVLRACREAGTVKRIVLTGSTSAIEYGEKCRPTHYEYNEEDWTDIAAKECSLFGKAMTLAEKAAWSYIETLPEGEKIDLVVLNSGFPLGPALVNVPSPNFSLIKNLVEGKLGLIPRISFPVTDVRDLAMAHQQALKITGVEGHRHIVITKTVTLQEVASILREAFLIHGYDVPTKVLPDFLAKTLGVFQPSLRSVRAQIGKTSKFSTDRMTNILKINCRLVETSLTEMVQSLIEHGIVYKPLSRPNRTQLSGATIV